MRYFFGLLCVCALGVMPLIGCSETTGDGGGGGTAGDGGNGGPGGMDGVGGMGPTDPCDDVECNDGSACTTHTCEADCTDEDGDSVDDVCLAICVYTDWPKDFPCDCVGFRCNVCDGSGSCLGDGTGGTGGSGGTTGDVFACTAEGIRSAIVRGGGPHTFDCGGPTTVTTEAEIVINNDVILDGEGNLTVDGDQDHRVFSVREVTAELHGFTVSGGKVVGDGGAGISNAGELMLVNSALVANVAEEQEACGDFGCFPVGGNGAGVYSGGHLVLVNSTVSGNVGTVAGGIANGGTLTLTDSTVSGNTGGGIEGGVWVALTNSTVSENLGSGISANGIVQVMDSIVSGNAAGGIVGGPGTLIVTNSTVSGNTADEAGGGIRIHGDFDTETEAFVVNSTVSGNAASNGSGIACLSATLTLLNSTVSDSIYVTGGDATEPPALLVTAASLIEGECTQEGSQVTWTSRGYNIESPGDSCGFDEEGDQVNVTETQLNLGPLANNGGPTMTHKPADGGLGSGSAAIDQIPEAACEVTTDQRGEPRPETGGTMCDVGSVEVQPPQ